MEWIRLTEVREKWRAVVKTGMKLLVAQIAENFLDYLR